MKATKLPTWDIQEHLKTEEDIAEYLNAALEENDPEFFLVAISDVVKASGAKSVAQRMGHGEKSMIPPTKNGHLSKQHLLIQIPQG